MGQIEKLLDTARAELGTKESPANSNNVKYNTWFYGHAVSGAAYAWCCVFAAWCFEQAGLAALWLNGNTKETAYCPYVEEQAQKKGQWVGKEFCPGDAVLFDLEGGSTADHIGLVESVNADGTLNTIEGNTGGQVMRHARTLGTVLGAYRPNYETEEDIVTRYNKISELPGYAQPVITALCDKGFLRGSGGAKDAQGRPADLDLSEDMARLIVVDARAGVYGKDVQALAG